MRKARLAILISGRGSNMLALIEACKAPDYPAEPVVVLSNNTEAAGLEKARHAGIPTSAVNHKSYESREAFEAAMIENLEPFKPDLICLAGFMRVLTPVFILHYQGRILNTHPSLLPRHGGIGMYGERVHRAVLAAGDKESGVSVHYVIDEVDHGDVILQARVPVLADDTPETLGARVLEQEHIAYPRAVEKIARKIFDYDT